MINLDYDIEENHLRFIKPAKTSRNTFTNKTHWLIKIWDKAKPDIIGIGEAAPIEFLSPDYTPNLRPAIENQMEPLVSGEHQEPDDLHQFPSVAFAIECALLDLHHGGRQILFPSKYIEGQPIPINGLVWMDDLDEMLKEAIQKIEHGYNCLKFKIGSHDFDSECRFLETLRKLSKSKNIEIRLDANGAFLADEALEKLKELNRFHIHSIEQPIKSGQWEDMARLCKDSPLKIALDEELININYEQQGLKLLKTIKPPFIILKPTLLGGFKICDQWIKSAEMLGINWWATSALEGNYGLNAIAQWVSQYPITLPQGLGTGHLYQNNFPSFSTIRGGHLYYKTNKDF